MDLVYNFIVNLYVQATYQFNIFIIAIALTVITTWIISNFIIKPLWNIPENKKHAFILLVVLLLSALFVFFNFKFAQTTQSNFGKTLRFNGWTYGFNVFINFSVGVCYDQIATGLMKYFKVGKYSEKERE